MPIVLKSSKPSALGCHIYAGGFTLGVRKHFAVKAHLEEWQFGVETVRHNMPGIPIHVSEFGEAWPAENYAGVDLLYGNPPCASWSQAGVNVKKDKLQFNKDRYKHHALTKCTDLLFSLIPRVKPKFFVWECVAAAYTAGRAFVDEKSAICLSQGYSVTHLLFDGIDTGLPQHRRRFFFVAHRYAFPLERPSEEHRTMRHALEGLEDDEKRRPPHLPNVAKNVLDKTKKHGRLSKLFDQIHAGKKMEKRADGATKGRPGFLNYRPSWDQACTTVTGGPHIFHPDDPRHLTIEEQAAMCGYPRGYKFVGPVNDCYKQIAKAVLPPPAEWLARNIAAALLAREQERRQIHLVDFLHKVKT